MLFLYYPFYLITYWYKDIVWGSALLFGKFNSYLMSLLSVRLLVVTFFMPLKNEYRKGLVLFSIIFGMFIKVFLLAFIWGILLSLIIIEVIGVIGLAVLPIVLLIVPFYG